MARGRIKWTEKKIQQMEADGHGRGTGASYKPWIEVDMFSSLGRSRRVWSPKTDRTHHLLSDVEYRLFLALEWQTDIVDIREQYPLSREMTQHVARTLGIRHPFYPGTNVPTVMTVDFFVTWNRGQSQTHEAFNAKRDEEAEVEDSLLKLEIQRSCLEQLNVPHQLVYHSQIPRQKVDNIDWIRAAQLKPKEMEPRPGYFGTISTRMAAELSGSLDHNSTLAQYCDEFDSRHGLERGTGIRVACMLMQDRVLKVDLSSPNLAAEALSSFVMTAQPGKLRAVGGR